MEQASACLWWCSLVLLLVVFDLLGFELLQGFSVTLLGSGVVLLLLLSDGCQVALLQQVQAQVNEQGSSKTSPGVTMVLLLRLHNHHSGKFSDFIGVWKHGSGFPSWKLQWEDVAPRFRLDFIRNLEVCHG